MKKFLALLLALAMIFALAACGAKAEEPAAKESAAEEPAAKEPAAEEPEDTTNEWGYDVSAADPIEIVFACPNGATNIETIYSEKWMEAVTERSEGKITFDYTNGGALGGYAELLDGVNMGVYDMTITDLTYFEKYVPETVALSLPCLVTSYEQAKAVFNGEIGDWMWNLVSEKSNMKVLNTYFCGFRYICSKAELTNLADCSGVLIRSPQIDLYTDLLGIMGFSYVTMAWSDAFTSMQTGVIDAVEVPLQNIYEFGFYDLGKNILCSRHLLSLNHVVANEDFWASLPEVYQAIMLDAFNEATAEEQAQCETNENDYMGKLEAEGVVFHEFTAEGKQELIDAFKPYWTEAVKDFDADTQNIIDQVIALG